MLLNVGSGGSAAAAPTGGAAGGAAAEAPSAAAEEEKKEEGKPASPAPNLQTHRLCISTNFCPQRRRNRTRTWALVSSTRLQHSISPLLSSCPLLLGYEHRGAKVAPGPGFYNKHLRFILQSQTSHVLHALVKVQSLLQPLYVIFCCPRHEAGPTQCANIVYHLPILVSKSLIGTRSVRGASAKIRCMNTAESRENVGSSMLLENKRT